MPVSAISMPGNLIEENDISRVMEMIGDGNAIYLSGAGGGNRIGRNVLHDNDSLTMNAVIRSDDDQHETVIEENLVLRSVGEGILIKGVSEVKRNVAADLRASDSTGRLTDYLRGYLVFTCGASNGSVVMDNTCLYSQDRSPFMTLGGGKGKYGSASEDLMQMERNLFAAYEPEEFKEAAEALALEVPGIPPVTNHDPFWPRIRIKETESYIRADE